MEPYDETRLHDPDGRPATSIYYHFHGKDQLCYHYLMNEGMNTSGRELNRRNFIKSSIAAVGAFAIKGIEKSSLTERGSKFAEFDDMIALFESSHSLAELHSIVDLTPEEDLYHAIWQPAKLALIPIVAKLNSLKQKADTSPQESKELTAKYMRLSRAVGMINNNKVYHNR